MERQRSREWLISAVALVALAVWAFMSQSSFEKPKQVEPQTRASGEPAGRVAEETSAASPRDTEANDRSNSLEAQATARPPIGAPIPDPIPQRPAPLVQNPPAAISPMLYSPDKPVQLPANRQEARESVDRVQFAIRDFRTNTGGNPEGDNAEITRALLGDNLKQVKIPVPDGTSINGKGEMCDAWGTPYFFHAMSRTHMEVRSAGPDRQMYTADDIVQ